MLKRWTALLLAVMLIFLTACSAQKEYKLSAVFAAAEEDRPQWLADPDNAALWEQLGLSGSVVSDGRPRRFDHRRAELGAAARHGGGQIRDSVLLR